jgi:hypothetical protein
VPVGAFARLEVVMSTSTLSVVLETSVVVAGKKTGSVALFTTVKLTPFEVFAL